MRLTLRYGALATQDTTTTRKSRVRLNEDAEEALRKTRRDTNVNTA